MSSKISSRPYYIYIYIYIFFFYYFFRENKFYISFESSAKSFSFKAKKNENVTFNGSIFLFLKIAFLNVHILFTESNLFVYECISSRRQSRTIPCVNRDTSLQIKIILILT